VTIAVTPRDALSGLDINVNAWEDPNVNPLISSDITSPDGAPLNRVNLSADGRNLQIHIDGPLTNPTYTYRIVLNLDLKEGVYKLVYRPWTGVSTYQGGFSESLQGTSVPFSVDQIGTWTWSSNESILWSCFEGTSKQVYFMAESRSMTLFNTDSDRVSLISADPSVSLINVFAESLPDDFLPEGFVPQQDYMVDAQGSGQFTLAFIVDDPENTVIYKRNPANPTQWQQYFPTISGNQVILTMEVGDPEWALGIIAVPVPPASATAPQIWSFDSTSQSDDTIGAVYQMEKNEGPGDDGQAGDVPIAAGEAQIWIADQIAMADVTYPSGSWVLFLSTDLAWGTQGADCDFQVGYWDPSDLSFTQLTPDSATLKSKGKNFQTDTETWSVLGERWVQSDSIMIPKDTYLAIKIINGTGEDRVVHTGEYKYCTYLRSPETDPGYPVPEIAAGVLLALGLAGLGAFIIIRRKSAKAIDA